MKAYKRATIPRYSVQIQFNLIIYIEMIKSCTIQLVETCSAVHTGDYIIFFFAEKKWRLRSQSSFTSNVMNTTLKTIVLLWFA